MINLLPEEENRIYRFEKSLLGFRAFSFENYSELKIINAYLHSYIKKLHGFIDGQAQLGMLYGIEHEIDELNNLRYLIDKDTEFKDRTNTTLDIIQQLITYLPPRTAKK